MKGFTEGRRKFWSAMISFLEEWKQIPFLLCGDFNVIASSQDIHFSLRKSRKSVLASDKILMQRILEQRCFDVWRQKYPNKEAYSFLEFSEQKPLC